MLEGLLSYLIASRTLSEGVQITNLPYNLGFCLAAERDKPESSPIGTIMPVRCGQRLMYNEIEAPIIVVIGNRT
jgi:hypothetical protein